MGHDIITICRHTLNTSGVEVLATELSASLQATILYGYQDTCSHFFNNEPGASYRQVQTGEIILPEAANTFFLEDDNYQLKEYYKKMGDRLFEIEKVKKEKSFSLLFKNNRFKECYYLYEKNATDEREATLLDDVFNCDFFYYSRWWQFCRLFMAGNSIDINYTQLNQYRQQLKQLAQQLGGSQFIYFDDQGDAAYLLYEAFSWEEILQEITNKFSASTFNIPAFMKQQQPVANTYPVIFFDDFTDL